MTAPSDGEARTAAKGISLLSLGRLAGLIVSFASTAILARLLAPADFGVLAASLIATGLATAFFDGAFAIGIVQREKVDATYLSSAFWLSAIIASVLIGAIWLVAPALSRFFGAPEYSLIFAVASFALLFRAMENIAAAYLRRTSRFGAISLYQFLATLIGYGPVSIYLAYRGFGAWALIAGQLAIAAIAGAGSLLLARMPLRFALTGDAVRDIVRTSGHFTFSQVLNWLALAGSNAVIGHMLGVHPLGLYARAWKLLDIVTTATAASLSSVLVPAFARMQSDVAKARHALERSLGMAVPLFAIVSTLAVVHASAIVAISLGEQWVDTVPLIQVLFAVLVPRCCYKITESVMIGFGRSRSAAIRQGVYATLMIGGAIVAAPFGPFWVAVNASCAVTVFYVSSLVYSARLTAMPTRVIMAMHARAVGVAVLLAAADLAVSSQFPPHAFWLGQFAGGGAAFAVLICALCAPEVILGPELTKMRRKLLSRAAASPRASSDSNAMDSRMTVEKIAVITRLTTQNAGNEALSRELIRFLKQRPNAEVRALDRYPVQLEHLKISALGQTPQKIVQGFERLVERLSAKLIGKSGTLAPLADEALVRLAGNPTELPAWLRQIKRRIGYRRNLAAIGLIGREEARCTLNTLAWADLVVWNPAGEFHPTGNPDQTFRLLLLMAVAKKLGARTAIINHSVEISDPRLQALVTWVYGKTDFIGVREQPSADRVLALDVPPDRVHIAPDLVFLASTSRATLPPAPRDIPVGAIGFSINGLEAFNGSDEWDTLLAKLKTLGRPFVFVSNAANHDLQLFRSLARKHGGYVVERQPGYLELRSIFSQLGVLISSRLHSSILALCEGTPVVTIEPSMFKVTGIFERLRYPFPTKNVALIGWSQAVVQDIETILARRDEYARIGRELMREQVAAIEEQYAAMFSLVSLNASARTRTAI